MLKRFAILTVVFALIIVGASSAAPEYETVRQGSSGETVVRVQLRLRDLDYLHFKPTGSFRGMTVSSTIAFQRYQQLDDGNWMSADGDAGPQTQAILFSTRAIRNIILDNVHMPIGPSKSSSSSAKGSLVTWQTLTTTMRVGNVYRVTDYNTGESFNVKFVGGTSHAEVECVTSEDTETFLKIFGGEFNYSKRAVVVKIGENNVAASLFGFPHGTDTISSNGMEGYTCLFFDGCTSHVGGVSDVEHQKQIYTAAGM